MKILSLDVSSHTGWAYFVDGKLMGYGLYEIKSLPEAYGNTYPLNYLECVENYVFGLDELVRHYHPDTIVIEETTPGKETYSEKLLLFIHHQLLRSLLNRTDGGDLRLAYDIVYLRTGEWRKTVGMRMSKEDQKGNLKRNLDKAKAKAKELRAQIKALGNKKANQAAVLELKKQLNSLQLGKITRKHLAVRIVNQLFNLGLTIGDNDTADAILLGKAFLDGAQRCDGRRPTMKKETA